MFKFCNPIILAHKENEIILIILKFNTNSIFILIRLFKIYKGINFWIVDIKNKLFQFKLNINFIYHKWKGGNPIFVSKEKLISITNQLFKNLFINIKFNDLTINKYELKDWIKK